VFAIAAEWTWRLRIVWFARGHVSSFPARIAKGITVTPVSLFILARTGAAKKVN
jgi:hypothetical protein